MPILGPELKQEQKKCKKTLKTTTLKIQNKREPKRTDFHILGFLRKQQSPLLALC